MTSLETAQHLRAAYHAACIPVGPDKRPKVKWSKYASELPTEDDFSAWFSNGSSIAIIAGNIQCLDVDIKHATPDLWTQFLDRCDEAGLTPLIERLVIQTTLSHGYHLVFRCRAPLRNVKLASNAQGEVILETRGAGGYFVVAPSSGYRVIQGSFDAIPEITEDERNDLLAIAVSFDQSAKHKEPHPAIPPGPGLTAGDDFDSRANVPAMLEAHGWTRLDPEGHHWRRPGKDVGISASWNVIPGRFWVWSTSTQFEAQHTYRPWHVFAVLHCNGDYTEAARTLGKMGYGSPARAPGGAKASPGPAADVARGEETSAVKPLTLWRPFQFIAWEEPPGSHFLLPAYVTRGELTALVGGTGVGKTRLMLWQAFCQLMRRQWCGLDTGGDPASWLFLSDENSLSRLKGDLTCMMNNFSHEERVFINDHIQLHAIVEDDDGDLWLGDAMTVARIKATIRAANPDVVVADPLANMAPEDSSKPEGMRRTVRAFADIVRTTAPKAARILIHHSRPGRQNILGGVGFDASAYGSGGKALVSSARCQINVMPGSEEDSNELVIACGKVNNCLPFTTRGVTFDPSSFTYQVNEDFDLDDWRAHVEGKALCSTCSIEDVVSAVRDGHRKTSDLIATLVAECPTKQRSAERAVTRAKRADAIMSESRGVYMLGRNALRYDK